MSKRNPRWDPKTMGLTASQQSADDKKRMVQLVTGRVPSNPIPSKPVYGINAYSIYFQNAVATVSFEPPPLDLPSRQQVDTIRAFKLAQLVTVDGGVKFQGAGSRVLYKGDDVASCERDKVGFFGGFSFLGDHEVPDPRCTCGFYAVPHKHAKVVVADYQSGAFCRLEVELFGRVIKHERGYRAQRQRVLSVAVLPQCRTIGPLQAQGGFVITFGGVGGGEVKCSNQAVGLRVDAGSIVPSCAHHAPLGFAPLTDVAQMLGTEVRWAT
jgi:hypothetical protein